MHRHSAPPPCLFIRSSLDEPAIQAILSMQNQPGNQAEPRLNSRPELQVELSEDTDLSVRTARTQ
jgi:hypothetical protein